MTDARRLETGQPTAKSSGVGEIDRELAHTSAFSDDTFPGSRTKYQVSPAPFPPEKLPERGQMQDPVRRRLFEAWIVATLLAAAMAVSAAARPVQARDPGPVWLDVDGRPLPFQGDEELVEFLHEAEIVHVEELGSGSTNPKKVVLERDGVRAHAIFRDVDLEARRIWHGDRFHMFFHDKAVAEVAAYRLARLLGLDTVPPAVVRALGGRQGSLQMWLEGAMTNRQRLERRLRPPEPGRWFRQTRRLHVFDNLIYNDDRHQGNLLVDGRWKMWMIDHTRAFQQDPRLRDPERITHVDAEMWRRLRLLPDEVFRTALEGVVSGAAIDALLERRTRIVSLVGELIASRGESAVVLTDGDPGDASVTGGPHRRGGARRAAGAGFRPRQERPGTARPAR